MKLGRPQRQQPPPIFQPRTGTRQARASHRPYFATRKAPVVQNCRGGGRLYLRPAASQAICSAVAGSSPGLPFSRIRAVSGEDESRSRRTHDRRKERASISFLHTWQKCSMFV